MSFGDLLVLLLFVLFVVLPSIQKAQRRGTGGAPPATGPRRAEGTGPRTAGVPDPDRPAAPTTAGSARDAFPPLEDDELSRRLAEARERVRQAATGTVAAGPPAPRVGGTQDPRARAAAPLVRPRTAPGAPAVDPRVRARAPLVARDRDDGLLATPLAPQAPAPPRAARSRPNPRDLRAEAPQVELERLHAGSAVHVPATALRFDAASIRDGFLWHQVLGAPRARRWLGGGPSPER